MKTPVTDRPIVSTFTATIYVGFKERATGRVHTIDEARAICQAYVDEVGLCVSLKPTEFLYTDGAEPGAEIGLINYPRFPSDREAIRAQAIELAAALMVALNQWRVSVVCPDFTSMLTNVELQSP